MLNINDTQVLKHATITGGVTERRLVLPNNVIANGNFVADTLWTKGGDWTIASGTAIVADGGSGDLSQTTDPLTSGTQYRVRFTLSRDLDTSLSVACGTNASVISEEGGTIVRDIVANGTGFKFTGATGGIDDVITLDNVSASVMPDDRSLRMHLRCVTAGYDRAGAPDGSKLFIEWTAAGTVNYFTWYPPAVGMATVKLPCGGIIGDPDTIIILTLSAGGGSVAGKINVSYGLE